MFMPNCVNGSVKRYPTPLPTPSASSTADPLPAETQRSSPRKLISMVSWWEELR